MDVIPPGESAITSLTIGADGNLYGGTSGKRANLFVLDPNWGHVFPLGHLPGEESIHHSLAAGSDSLIYIGTSLHNIGRIDTRGSDVNKRYEEYPAGFPISIYFIPGNRRHQKYSWRPQPSCEIRM